MDGGGGGSRIVEKEEGGKEGGKVRVVSAAEWENAHRHAATDERRTHISFTARSRNTMQREELITGLLDAQHFRKISVMSQVTRLQCLNPDEMLQTERMERSQERFKEEEEEEEVKGCRKVPEC